MESGIDQIAYYQQAKEVSPKVKEALQRVVHLRSKLDDPAREQDRDEIQHVGDDLRRRHISAVYWITFPSNPGTRSTVMASAPNTRLASTSQ